MENIIKKAIEGGYELGKFTIDNHEKGESYNYYSDGNYIVTLDPLFWQALGKACLWNRYSGNVSHKGIMDFTFEDGCTTCYALRFHEINLTEGWDKAVEYLTQACNIK